MQDTQATTEPDATGQNHRDTSHWRPLSSAPEQEKTVNGEVVRVDSQGRILCKAKRRDGNLCKSPAVNGMKVCRMHGASTPRSKNMLKMRLAELAAPAISVLAREMASADKSVDRQRAANSILDRAGHGRHQKFEIDDARVILAQRLIEATENAQAQAELEAEQDLQDLRDAGDLEEFEGEEAD